MITLDTIRDPELREKKLVELNVQEQVTNVARLKFIQEAWSESEFPYIHGWVFNVENGMLKNLDVSVNSADHLDALYRFES
jgi:carbonic anhydrase